MRNPRTPCASQGLHVLLDVLLGLVDDADDAEHVGEALDGVGGVAVVELVVASLHDDDPFYPGRSSVAKVHLRREVRRIEVRGSLPSRERVAVRVGSPEMNMGVNPGHRYSFGVCKGARDFAPSL